jgi:O-methyltransferase
MDNAFISQMFHWNDRTPLAWHRPINKVLAKLRINAQLNPRAFTWGMGNVESRMNVFFLANQCAAYDIPGDFAEVGCNSGESSVIIQRILNELAPHKKLHCFDSFEGLPELKGQDATEGVYQKGWMGAALEKFHSNFKEAGLEAPEHIYKGWFEDTVPQNLPDKISFALVDGDIYTSTKHVLPHVYERMSPGAICMFGVYYDDEVFSRPHTIDQYKSPGVKRATDEFFKDKPENVSVLYANEYSNGWFRKL